VGCESRSEPPVDGSLGGTMNTTNWMKGSLVATIALLGACTADTPEEATDSSEQHLSSSAGLSFSSAGDPHEQTGDGFAFENQKHGTFTAIKSYSAIVKDGTPAELMVLKKQETCGTGVTCNTHVAVYVAGTTIKLTADGTLMINGVGTTLATNQGMKLPKPDGTSSGALLKRTDPQPGVIQLTLLSPVGDVIYLQACGWYINISGTISLARPGGRVRGSLGCFDADNDQSDDLCKRFVKSLNEIETNGVETFYTLDSGGIDAFLEDWRTVQADCSLADVGVDATGHCSW
jgi:hypothetical protein